MRLALLAVVACSSPPKSDPGYPNIPVENEPRDASVPDDAEALPFVPLGADPNAEPREPFNPGKPASSIPAVACIPAGHYKVKVDLEGAKLSQANTGMDDLRWCKSMLEGVPATTMAILKIAVDAGQMTVEWPPGKASTIVSLGPCSFGITSPPMIAQLTFKNGKASGATSFAVGTQNHPDESCSAVGAKLFLDNQN
jgi:hypothetical protein